ncbi:glycosyltransferase [Methylococcus sp. Mc7]|uniref:glycosyltransferase n=1 Tax=Methylococcus sp. Mc7 TaxID=2860258 RepID=UPI001C532583|nr:glycosyltransferase [Methylococcus sp. Mc7]QXP84021.1 glycosyltransferase family 4 protein [Methylococcus sp. Mc7]
MMLFVAPYNGEKSGVTRFHGASRKIRLLLEILSGICQRVVLLNTLPIQTPQRRIAYSKLDLGGGILIDVVTPGASNPGRVGYLINLARVSAISNSIISSFGVPDTVWCYNGYAMESRIGGFLKSHFGSRFILEFEDWHFARNRGFNPKPFIDWFFSMCNMRNVDYGFAVNQMLKHEFDRRLINSELLPGVLEDWVIGLAATHPPFQDSRRLTIGYFGGLEVDKGAGFLLQLMEEIKKSKFPLRFIVTGSGSLERKFSAYTQAFPDIVDYRGSVADLELKELMGITDVIINPHCVNKGVFPFKVLEGVASGRLLVSTPLGVGKGELGWLNSAVAICPQDVNSFITMLMNAREIYASRRPAIEEAVALAARLWSKESLRHRIARAIRA